MGHRRYDKVFDKDGEQDAWGETLKAFRLNHAAFFHDKANWKQPAPIGGGPSSASTSAATNASLATRLQSAREKCFLSLAGASRRIGCSKMHLWELEDGRATNPGIKLLRAAAETYGVTVSWLIGESR